MTTTEHQYLEEVLAQLGEEYIPTRYHVEKTRLRMWSKIEEHKRMSVRYVASSILQRVLSGLVSFVFVFVLFGTFLLGSQNSTFAEDLGELHIEQGDVYITRSSQRFKALPGEKIKKNDIIEVSSTSSAHVTFNQQKTIHLADNSKIKVRRSPESNSENISFDIEKGKVETSVDRNSRSTFTVHTQEKIITVSEGAAFAIAIDPDTKEESIRVDESSITVIAKEEEGVVSEPVILSSSLDSENNSKEVDKKLLTVKSEDQGRKSIKTTLPITEKAPQYVEQPKIALDVSATVSTEKVLSYLSVARVKLRGVVEAINAGDIARADDLSQSYIGTTSRIADELNIAGDQSTESPFVGEYTQVAANLSQSTLDRFYKSLPMDSDVEQRLVQELEELYAIESSTILHAELSTITELPGKYLKNSQATSLVGEDFIRHVENQVVARVDDLKNIQDEQLRSQALVNMLDRVPNDTRNYDIVESMYEHVPEDLRGYVRIKMYDIKGKEIRLKQASGSGQLLQE